MYEIPWYAEVDSVPAQGVASVEKVAVAAVMAGCLPDYFPVVVAAVRAADDGVAQQRRQGHVAGLQAVGVPGRCAHVGEAGRPVLLCKYLTMGGALMRWVRRP